MQSQVTGTVTSEQAFCAAITCLAQGPPEASAVEGGHKPGLSRGLVLLGPLHRLLTEQTGKCLTVDRFATHLVQFTRNQARVSIEHYWEGQRLHEAAYVVQHPSKKPMCLAKLLDILRTCGTSIWLARSAGVEGQRLMHALQQPSLALAGNTLQHRLDMLTQQPHVLSERQTVISQRLRAQRDVGSSSDPAAGSSNASELQQPAGMQSDLAEGSSHLSQTDMRQTDAGQTDRGVTDEGQQSQGQHSQCQADQGLAARVQADRGQHSQGQAHEGQADQGLADRGQTGQVHDGAAVEGGRGGSRGQRVTRASARQVALLQDMHATGHESTPSSARAAPSDRDLAAGLTEQDSFYTASEEILDENGVTHSEGSPEQEDPACQPSHQEGHQGSGDVDGEEEDSARSWDSSCPQAFVWDKKSSLMVCVDGEKKAWYQARVVSLNNSQYLLSWPAFPDRPEEWVDRNSRRIWRQDQVKHEYWNQQAPAFKQSKNRAWVLKACYWQWQMSSRSDFLSIPHKDPAVVDQKRRASARIVKPKPVRVDALRQESQDSPRSQAPALMDLGRGFCFGCWTTKGGLQSVCGKCRVGACQKCRTLWAEKRMFGATIDEAGLMVNQSNICFCGGHLTPRGAAAYDRKGNRGHPRTMPARSSK